MDPTVIAENLWELGIPENARVKRELEKTQELQSSIDFKVEPAGKLESWELQLIVYFKFEY